MCFHKQYDLCVLVPGVNERETTIQSLHKPSEQVRKVYYIDTLTHTHTFSTSLLNNP